MSESQVHAGSQPEDAAPAASEVEAAQAEAGEAAEAETAEATGAAEAEDAGETAEAQAEQPESSEAGAEEAGAEPEEAGGPVLPKDPGAGTARKSGEKELSCPSPKCTPIVSQKMLPRQPARLRRLRLRPVRRPKPVRRP